jgi:TRAP-type transport system periplasmic protein
MTHVHRWLRRAALAAVPFLLAGVTSAPVVAQEYPSLRLRSAQVLVSAGIASEAHQWWADEIRKRTNGRVTIQTFWAGSLVAPRDIPAAVAGGAVDIGHVASTYDPARTRLWMTLDLPFNVRDHYCAMEAGRRVSLENEHLAAELRRNNMVPVVGYNSGFQQFISKDAIKTFADLKGRRLRSYGGARVPFLERLGVTPVFMPFGEIYEAVDRGVLDGSADIAIYLYSAFKLHEVAKHMLVTDSGAAIAAPLAVFNRARWERLPKNLQDLILEIGREHDMRYAKALIDAEKQLLVDMPAKHGVTNHYLNDADKAAMEKAAKDVQEKWIADAETAGLPARNVWEHFQRVQSECIAQVKEKGYPWEKK